MAATTRSMHHHTRWTYTVGSDADHRLSFEVLCDKLTRSILDATVDLNPHQIDAALFAFRSPLSRGAILADEVGLGKTIEAGLVISQLWAERKRKILVITPPTLCKQWSQELIDKFFLPSKIIDSRAATAYRKSGFSNPLNVNGSIAICSYHFARAQDRAVRAIAWDLVVIDEAHRLRNVIKSGNKIAKAIQAATHGTPKLLLTATPLQNSLLELYGLVSFLDEHIFGDLASFRGQYLRGALTGRQFEDLKRRLQPICQRTLRRQVTEYVRYTNRISVTQDFTPTDEEVRLYREVSDYLQRDELLALPASRRKLMTLVLRKLLASSSFAIAGTLQSLVERLRKMRGEIAAVEDPPVADFEAFNELREEWDEADADQGPDSTGEKVRAVAQIDAEIGDLNSFRDLAISITTNAKGYALLNALRLGFQKLQTLGASRKAIIFTESRRTQEYLLTHVESNGYADQVMLFNGTNTDARSAAIYEAWRIRHEGEDVVTNSKNIDLRAALVIFGEEDHIFTLRSVPLGCQPVPLGKYQVVARDGAKEGCHAYRTSHALAEFILKRAANRTLGLAEVCFCYSDHPGKISLVERLVGKAGWLTLKRLSVTALEREERLVFAAQDDSGAGLDQETCERLFDVGGAISQAGGAPLCVTDNLEARFESARASVLSEIGERNGRFFDDEIEKLERWADDLKEGLESELKELDAEIKNLKRLAKTESDLEAKLTLHRNAKDLESDRSQKRRALYDAQDDIERRKEALIAEVEARLKQSIEEEVLFTIRWQVR
jgi:hypothetical protein